MDVDPAVPGAVHLRVLLGRADQVGDARGGVQDLAQQALGLHRVGEPADRALQRVLPGRREHGLHVLDAQPTGDEHRREVPAAADVVAVEPVAELVLEVRGLHRRQRRCVAHLLDELVLRHHQLLQLRAGELPRRDHGELVAHAGHAVAQGVGGAARCGGGVVELVGEPGRELAQGQQPFPFGDLGVGLAHPQQHPLQQVHRHRVPARELPCELPRRQGQHRHVGDGPDRGRVVPRRLVVEVELHRPEVDAGLLRADGLHGVAADEPAHRDGARKQHVEAQRRFPLADDVLPRRDLDDVGVLGHPPELLLVELGEQEQLAELSRSRVRPLARRRRFARTLARRRRFAHCSARYRCTSVTAIAPSPTADATRLTDSARTSPATNTPGTLDSRW